MEVIITVVAYTSVIAVMWYISDNNKDDKKKKGISNIKICNCIVFYQESINLTCICRDQCCLPYNKPTYNCPKLNCPLKYGGNKCPCYDLVEYTCDLCDKCLVYNAGKVDNIDNVSNDDNNDNVSNDNNNDNDDNYKFVCLEQVIQLNNDLMYIKHISAFLDGFLRKYPGEISLQIIKMLLLNDKYAYLRPYIRTCILTYTRDLVANTHIYKKLLKYIKDAYDPDLNEIISLDTLCGLKNKQISYMEIIFICIENGYPTQSFLQELQSHIKQHSTPDFVSILYEVVTKLIEHEEQKRKIVYLEYRNMPGEGYIKTYLDEFDRDQTSRNKAINSLANYTKTLILKLKTQ